MLAPGTTDVAGGFEMGFEPRFGYADGPVDTARSSLADLTVFHRFASSRGAIRVALDPVGAVDQDGPRVPIVREL